MARFLFFLLVLQSCSANYHLKKALKKNPKLGDSTTVFVPYYKDTTITINIIGDTSDQTMKFKKWYKQAMDSVAVAYNDSFVQVNQTIDSLGNLKTNVIRKPFKESVKATIKGEAEVKIPPMITVEEKGFKINSYIWVLLAIFVAGFCIKKL